MSAPRQHADSAAALSVRGLRKEYIAGQPVFSGIDLEIGGTGLTAIIGSSGAGKSTLIRCINRLVAPTSGHILFEGCDLAQARGRALREARRRIGMVFQEYNLVERLTVMENLLTGRLGYIAAFAAWRRKFPPADIERAYGLLETVGLAEFANTRADALSGGQRQRVGIARALMQQPHLILADEPTSSLDPKTAVEIMTLLAEQGQAAGIPVLVNMHDVGLARRFAHRVIGMARGGIVFDGTPDALDDDMLKTIYGGTTWLQ
ncbi:MAG: phosphonate ABC transporter ATP-binding protein [Rhodocyclaceae bacterium]|nr:phosphonate ABC transporter ATP-binding protein [Rhodocyclaceae bacterium]